MLTNLLQPWYNKDVTRLSTQGCDNLVISSMWRICVVTSCQQVVPNMLTTCDKQCEYILFTVCWQTCYKMWDFWLIEPTKSGSCKISWDNRTVEANWFGFPQPTLTTPYWSSSITYTYRPVSRVVMATVRKRRAVILLENLGPVHCAWAEGVFWS